MGCSQVISPRRVGSGGWNGRDRLGRKTAAGRTQGVEALVGRDAVKPRTQRRPLLETGQAPPGRQQRLLQHVFGVGQRTGQPIAVHPQLPPVRLDKRAERPLLSRPGRAPRMA